MDYVLKIFSDQVRWRNETGALKILEGKGAPVLIDCGANVLGVGGWMVTPYWKLECNWITQNKFSKSAFSKFARQLSKMHTETNFDRYGSIWNRNEQYDSWWDYIEISFLDGFSYLKHLERITSNQLQQIEKTFFSLKEKFCDEPHHALIHRDLGPSNVCFSSDAESEWRYLGLIDFEHSIVGDSWFDLSRLQAEILSERADLADIFWDEYQVNILLPQNKLRLLFYDLLRSVRGVRYGKIYDDIEFVKENEKKILKSELLL